MLKHILQVFISHDDVDDDCVVVGREGGDGDDEEELKTLRTLSVKGIVGIGILVA